jgi:hypothetical protein
MNFLEIPNNTHRTGFNDKPYRTKTRITAIIICLPCFETKENLVIHSNNYRVIQFCL